MYYLCNYWMDAVDQKRIMEMKSTKVVDSYLIGIRTLSSVLLEARAMIMHICGLPIHSYIY